MESRKKLGWLNSIKVTLSGNSKADRRMRKFLYGIEDFPTIPLRAKVVRSIFGILTMSLFALWMFSIGFFYGTGTLPFQTVYKSTLPPEIQPEVTAAQAVRTIEESPLDLSPYGEGNNCVELALVAARQLWWDGYQGTVVKIDFADGTGHMVVGVPTSDEGWKFLNPQGNVWVNPIIGGVFMGNEITGMFYLYDFVWKPIEQELEANK